VDVEMAATLPLSSRLRAGGDGGLVDETARLRALEQQNKQMQEQNARMEEQLSKVMALLASKQ
jgi:hypothetical protein